MAISSIKWCLLGYPMLWQASKVTINNILAKKLDILVIVYLDDIFIYTEDPG